MRIYFVLSCVLLAAPAHAWRLWGEPSDRKIAPIQAYYDAGKPSAVLSALTPDYMQSLRGKDLRQAYILKGDSLDALGQTAEALSVYQLGVKLFPNNVDLLTRLGGILHRNGLDEQARPLFEKALEFEPKHFGAHLGLAEISRGLGFLDKSSIHYEAALETLDRRADVWRDYAETLIAHRDFGTAKLAAEKAIRLAPANSDGYVIIGFVRRAQNDTAGALAALDEALNHGAGIGAKRAKALWLLEAGRTDQALSLAQEISAEYSADEVAAWVKSRALLEKGSPTKAAAALTPLVNGERSDFIANAARSWRRHLLMEAGSL